MYHLCILRTIYLPIPILCGKPFSQHADNAPTSYIFLRWSLFFLWYMKNSKAAVLFLWKSDNIVLPSIGIARTSSAPLLRSFYKYPFYFPNYLRKSVPFQRIKAVFTVVLLPFPSFVFWSGQPFFLRACSRQDKSDSAFCLCRCVRWLTPPFIP